jgi:hypothetical protein
MLNDHGQRLSEPLTIRVTAETLLRIEALASVEQCSRHNLARRALMIGLDILQGTPNTEQSLADLIITRLEQNGYLRHG